MKAFLILLLLSSLTVAAGETLPDFSAKLDLAADVSLSAAIKRGRMMPVPQASSNLVRSGNVEPKYRSRMPVIRPAESVDVWMPIGKPDSSKNFRMLAREPKVVNEE